VVNAADIPGTQKDRFQKEDKWDNSKIANAPLDGNLSANYTPSEKTDYSDTGQY